jgi:hypothetical protein
MFSPPHRPVRWSVGTCAAEQPKARISAPSTDGQCFIQWVSRFQLAPSLSFNAVFSQNELWPIPSGMNHGSVHFDWCLKNRRAEYMDCTARDDTAPCVITPASFSSAGPLPCSVWFISKVSPSALVDHQSSIARRHPSPYSLSFRYSVRSPIPSTCAALRRLPACSLSTVSMARRSMSAIVIPG